MNQNILKLFFKSIFYFTLLYALPSSSSPIVHGELYNLISVSSGKCLDVYDDGSGVGANVVQWGCNNADNQKFGLYTIEGPSNTYILKPLNDEINSCIDIYSGSSNNGTNVVQWTCNNADQQKFKLEHVSGSDNTFIIKSVNSGMRSCIDVYGAYTHNGANVVQWACNNADNQKWYIVKAELPT